MLDFGGIELQSFIRFEGADGVWEVKPITESTVKYVQAQPKTEVTSL
jgi:hypothetical protein